MLVGGGVWVLHDYLEEVKCLHHDLINLVVNEVRDRAECRSEYHALVRRSEDLRALDIRVLLHDRPKPHLPQVPVPAEQLHAELLAERGHQWVCELQCLLRQRLRLDDVPFIVPGEVVGNLLLFLAVIQPALILVQLLLDGRDDFVLVRLELRGHHLALLGLAIPLMDS